MLNELGPWLSEAKAKELLGRLESDDPKQAVPAEYELIIGWALSKRIELTVAPTYGGSEPDFRADGLFGNTPTVIEVTALSDDSLSGKAAMNRTADIVNQFAGTVRKGAYKNLYYVFFETSGSKSVRLPKPLGPFTHANRFWRKRLTSNDFRLTDQHKELITAWMKEWPPPKPLRLTDGESAFDISWKEWVHPQLKTFSSMPSEAYDLKLNPLYTRLKDKEKGQLKAVPEGYLRCIVLGDTGCRLLSHPNESDASGRRVNGAQIIWEFLRNSTVDIVLIVSPKQDTRIFNSDRYWTIEIFDKVKRPDGYYAALQSVRDFMPRPQLHGYQAWSWMQQGMCHPQGRGMYLPTIWGGHSVKISSRALLELLSGRMNAKDYEHFVTGKPNPFEIKLAQGFAISDIKLEPRGPERDDDYIEFTFTPDPNASSLTMPSNLNEK